MDIRILVYQKKSRIVFFLTTIRLLKKQEHAKYQEKNFGACLTAGLPHITY